MKKLLSRFVRHEVYASLSGSELRRLDVGAAAGLKQAPEIGLYTERERDLGLGSTRKESLQDWC